MEGALKGIRVLDVTYYVPGPYAGMRLARMGAEVIKIQQAIPPGIWAVDWCMKPIMPAKPLSPSI